MTKAVLRRDCFTCVESHVWLQCSACCSGGVAWPAAGAEGGEGPRRRPGVTATAVVSSPCDVETVADPTWKAREGI